VPLPWPAVEGSAKLRTTALLCAGALVVHELRYRIAFGSDGPTAMAPGHEYLTALTPLVVVGGMLALASLVQRVAGTPSAPGPRRASIWLLMTTGLLATFCLQETLEAWLATGRPDGLSGVFGDGGWLAVPLSMGVAAFALLVVRLARAGRFAGMASRLVRVLAAAPALAVSDWRPFRRGALLARHLAGRSPPVQV
jgi:hypothetical protein